MSTNDPLDEFFARERAAIEPHPVSEDHWASILEEHRRARRPHVWRYVVGAAAAVVAVGALGLALRPDAPDSALPATTSTYATTSAATSVPTTAVVTVTTTVEGTPTTVTVPVSTSKPTGGPVLRPFAATSVTNTGNGHLAALGTASCSGSRCGAIISTTDGGVHWTVTASFPGEIPGPDGPRILRFAGTEVGWLVGKDVRRTTDGGRHWTAYDHPGEYVYALETDGRDVVIVAGDSPTVDGTHELIVSRAPVGATSATQVGAPLRASAFSGADLVWRQHTAYVLPHGQDGADSAYRVDSAALTALPAVPGRAQVGLVASAGGDGTLFSFGAQGGAAGSAGYSVHASTDGGKTWKQRTGEVPLLLANAGQVAFTATDGDHLVAASGGSSDLHGSLKVSSDGGKSWHDPAKAPPMPDRGWAWLGSPGGGIVYAIPVDPSGSYWVSSDHGEHWAQATLDS